MTVLDGDIIKVNKIRQLFRPKRQTHVIVRNPPIEEASFFGAITHDVLVKYCADRVLDRCR